LYGESHYIRGYSGPILGKSAVKKSKITPPKKNENKSYGINAYYSKNKIKDLSPLKNLHKLKVLTISSHFIKDLSPLKNLTNLEVLDLSDNNIEDLSPLAELKKIEELDLSKNKIKNIAPLMNLKNIKKLNLSYNAVEHFETLKEFKNLEHLDLTKNFITSFDFIKHLKSPYLAELLLCYNPIRNREFLKTYQKELRKIKLSLDYSENDTPNNCPLLYPIHKLE